MILKTIFRNFLLLFFLLASFFQTSLYSETSFYLRENLKKANRGDYLVTMQGKTFTLYHIKKIEEPLIFIEEVSIPSLKFQAMGCLFRTWFTEGAQNNSSRSMYAIDLNSGQMTNSYAFMNDIWVEKPLSNVFLSTLLNLHLNPIPLSERKKIGGNGNGYWQPKLVFDGQWIKNAPFYAWATRWPDDNSELSGKTIEVYLPENSDLYPAYLPYWLEISGVVGSQKIRIVDSGKNL